MFMLIPDDTIDSGTWKTLTLDEGDTPHTVRLPVGPVLVPLSVWRARRTELIHREYEHGWPLGIWLAEDESPESIAGDIDDFTVIAFTADRFINGKGHTLSRLLCEQYGFRGELRTVGNLTSGISKHPVQPGARTARALHQTRPAPATSLEAGI